MNETSLPQPPAGLSWKKGTGGHLWLYGRYQLPGGRKIERSTETTSIHVARRRYCKMQRQIADAYAAGVLDKFVGTRAKRSDAGKKRAKAPVKQVARNET